MTIISQRLRIAGAAILGSTLALAASSAAAEPDAALRSYAPCDGYGAPSSSDDGMTAQAMELLYFIPSGPNGTTVRSPAAIGASGVAACDEALAALAPGYWRRKVSLIQARALHQFGREDAAAGLADLQRAREAAQGSADAYFQRSQAIAGDYLQAYALRLSGDRKAASALALRALSERPYNRQAAASALAAMGGAADSQDVETALRGMARLDPATTSELFWRTMEQRRFAEAAALYPALVPPMVPGDEPMSAVDRTKLYMVNRFRAEMFWAKQAGAYAYALAAEGDSAEARTVLEQARARLRKVVAEPSTLPLTRKGNPHQLTPVWINEKGKLDIQGNEALDFWSAMVERRIGIRDGQAEDVLKSLTDDPLPHTPVAVDIVDALIAGLPPQETSAKPALEALRRDLAAEPKDDMSDLATLFVSLPEAETADRALSFTPLKKVGFWGAPDSYVEDRNPDGSVTVISRGIKATNAAVEELALLHAAYLAREAGKGGLFVLGRRDIQHTTISTYMGVGSPYHTGYETQLTVLLVDPQALPAGYEKAGWRVIAAADVLARLGPAYAPPVQPDKR